MRAWLSQRGVDFHARDFFDQPFSETELRGLLIGSAVESVFSWSSPSFRKLGVSRVDLTDNELISMMLDEPRLIRRPLIFIDNEIIEPISGAGRIIELLKNKI